MLEEVSDRLDPTRTHFLGKVPYVDYMRVPQLSAAQVGLTYPFVLSWPMLEATATQVRHCWIGSPGDALLRRKSSIPLS